MTKKVRKYLEHYIKMLELESLRELNNNDGEEYARFQAQKNEVQAYLDSQA